MCVHLAFSHFSSAVPPPVEELKMIQQGKSSVQLTWKEPKVAEELYTGNLTYSIECDRCNKLTFFPAKTNLKKTYVNISGLSPGQSYTFKVLSMNSLKNITWKFASINVTLSGQYICNKIPLMFNAFTGLHENWTCNMGMP